MVKTTGFMTDLEKYRAGIDLADRQLIDILAHRFGLAAEIGKIKHREGISVLQSARRDEIISSRKEYALKAGLSEKFAEEIMNLVHSESVRIQQEFAEK